MRWISKIIVSFSLLLILIAEFVHPTKELSIDLGEHLLKGQLLFQTHNIPTTNTFSYTYPNFHFINLEWLAEAIFYLINLFLGVNGLIIFTLIITLFSMAIIYKFVAKRVNLLLIAYTAIFYLIVAYERAAVRPEIFSYLFLSIFIVLLYKFREKYTKFIWFLIPLQLIWVNMHIYFIVGILLVGLFLFEAIIIFRKRDRGKYIKTLLIILVSNILVSLLNPYGMSGLLFPLLFWQNYPFSVDENSSIFQYSSGHPEALFATILIYALLSIVLIFLMILQFRKVRLIDVLISIVFITGAGMIVRNLSLFVFATFIPFTFLANSLLEKNIKKVNKKVYGFLPKLSIALTLFFPILAVVILVWILSQLGVPALGATHRNKIAVNFFINNKLNGPIFNNYDIGGYLAYRLYPKEKVFVDNRPEAYPASFFNQVYTPMQQDLSVFQKADKEYNFNSIIYSFNNGVPQYVGFIRYLVQSNDWNVVYLDDTTIVLVRSVSKNKEIIQKFLIKDSTYRLPINKSTDNLFNLAHFLNLIGWKRSEIEANLKMYEINPKNCAVLNNLIVLVGQKSEYVLDYTHYCTNINRSAVIPDIVL